MQEPLDMQDLLLAQLTQTVQELKADLRLPVKTRVTQDGWDELTRQAQTFEHGEIPLAIKFRGVPIVCDLPSTHPKDFVLVYEV